LAGKGHLFLQQLESTEATSLDWKICVWQIPVFSYGLLMRNWGYIEFETFEKTVLVISKEY
jgi:hypothetical protein